MEQLESDKRVLEDDKRSLEEDNSRLMEDKRRKEALLVQRDQELSRQLHQEITNEVSVETVMRLW